MLRAQAYAQGVVHGLAMRHRDVDVAPPARAGVAVALLQLHHHGARPIGERRLAVEAGGRGGVEALQIRELFGILAAVVQVRHQASEPGAPVAHVVLSEHLAAKRFEHPRHRIADDRAAQMMHLHLLGEIGVRIVDDHARRRVQRAQQRRGDDGLGKPRIVDDEADETRAGDLGARDAFELRRFDDALGQFPRLHPQAFGGRHGAVRLVVAEIRSRGRADDGRRANCPGGGEGGVKARGE